MPDVNFSHFSERDWCAIEKVARISGFDMTALRKSRGWIEQLCRDCVSYSSVDSKEFKFLEAKKKQAAEFRRQMVGLPPELEQCAADTADKIERYCQDRTLQLCQDYDLQVRSIEAGTGYLRISYLSAHPNNAHNLALDCLCKALLEVLMIIGGRWSGRSNTKANRNFIAACARPAVGLKPTTERAIGERLYRLDQRRCRTDSFDKDFAAASRVSRVGGHFKRKQILIDISDRPSNANEF